ncbi:MAG: hypothetical protein OEU26_10800 [Candidatus Tectomicrobia bacterium]|nr:hypothetical protein [Candidatus Tectomicrobia bacterium]
MLAEPANRGLFQYSDPTQFFLGYLKEKQRRKEARHFGKEIAQYLQTSGLFKDRSWASIKVEELTDVQCVGFLWAVYVSLYRHFRQSVAPCAMQCLESEIFFHRRPEALQAIANFFGIELSDAELGGILVNPVFDRHAKQLSRAFDLAEREAEYQRLSEALKDEVAEGLEWISDLLGESGHALPLPGSCL